MWRMFLCLPIAHSTCAVFPAFEEDDQKTERNSMNMLQKYLEIGSSPHISSGASVDVIMRNVFVALLPVCVFSVYAFGIAAALVLATATLSCVATEYALCRMANKPATVGDWSQLQPLQCGYPAAIPNVGDYLTVTDPLPDPAPGTGRYYITSVNYQGHVRYGRKAGGGVLSGRDPALLPPCN